MMTASDQSANSLFTLRDIHVDVGARRILDIPQLALKRGEVTGFIGHNGSGKSTLLKVLARQMNASGGEVAYLGHPLQEWGSSAFARRLAYLPQYTPSTQGLLVRELVLHGRYPWHGAFGRVSEEDKAKVEEALRLTDIGSFADRLVDTLSGGERQRVWLAMLLAQDAECFLLDEPTSALDIQHQVEVLDLVKDLSRQRDLSVILVLHDINMAARTCERLIALKGGRQIADGTPEDIMTEVQLQEVFGLNLGVMPHPAGEGLLAYVV